MTKASPFVFVSYSRTDQEYAKSLVNAFKERNLAVWMDDSIVCGEAWSREIWQHLKSCQVFVLVMTPRALESHWVNCELIAALEQRKKIFPVLLEGERWYNVATIQYVNVRDRSLPPDSFFKEISSYALNSPVSAGGLLSTASKDNSETADVQENHSEDPEKNVFETLRKELAEQKNIRWAGDWFVNVGEGEARTWEDCVKYGFISAGQGAVYSDALKKLGVGSTIYAYMSGLGYVGLGKVSKQAVPIGEFTVGEENMPLLSMNLKAERPDKNSDNLELSEWVVGVKWLKTFPKDNPQKFVGAFANPNVVCKLRNKKTLEFLRKKFGWAGNWFVNVGEGSERGEGHGQRSWEDCVQYGFICAGQGPQFARAIRRLKPGDTVYAYVSTKGYVGFGEVVEEAIPIKEFTVGSANSPLLSKALKANGLSKNVDDPEFSEWVARIKWLKTYPKEQARQFAGAFVYPGTLCHLNDQKTLDLLHREFGE